MQFFVHDILDFPTLHLHLKICIGKCRTMEIKKTWASRFKIQYTFTLTLKFPSDIILWLESVINDISDFIKSIELLTNA